MNLVSTCHNDTCSGPNTVTVTDSACTHQCACAGHGEQCRAGDVGPHGAVVAAAPDGFGGQRHHEDERRQRHRDHEHGEARPVVLRMGVVMY